MMDGMRTNKEERCISYAREEQGLGLALWAFKDVGKEYLLTIC
jgi:hypothetical protein